MNGRPLRLFPAERPHDLTDLPNITIALGEALKRAGILSAELHRLGTERAWERVGAAGGRRDVPTLLALEGAIAGIPWRDLPRSRRSELLRRFAPGGQRWSPGQRQHRHCDR